MESADVEKLIELLQHHMSGVNARALVARALRENGLSGSRVTRQDLGKSMATLRRGVDLFVAITNDDDLVRRCTKGRRKGSIGHRGIPHICMARWQPLRKLREKCHFPK